MNTPLKVHILIESYTEDQHIVQNAEGNMYPKGDRYYIRYEESSPEMTGTVTTIKLENEGIRIIRQGSNLRSEQSFVSGQRLKGYYDTPQGKLDLETETGSLAVNLIKGIGNVEWNYVLYVMGEMSGSYRLRLTITAS